MARSIDTRTAGPWVHPRAPLIALMCVVTGAVTGGCGFSLSSKDFPAFSATGQNGSATQGSGVVASRSGIGAVTTPQTGLGTASAEGVSRAVSTAGPADIVIETQPGDTVMALARHYDIPVSLLMTTNNLRSLDLAPGTRLIIPKVQKASRQARG